MMLLLSLVAGVGFAMLYSAANGSFEPWASAQMMRFGLGLGMMIVAALIDIRFWFRYAYLIYFTCLVLLGAVEVMGDIGMGAQRWIDLGVVRLQPSEMMKVALILALARYFHGLRSEEHTSELQSLMRISYAVFCLKKKKTHHTSTCNRIYADLRANGSRTHSELGMTDTTHN